MRSGLNLGDIFPVTDAPSAAFGLLKAEILCGAGVIDEADERLIRERAAAYLRPAQMAETLYG